MESLTNKGLNRVVVVTGAARGIGLDTAQVLNQHGWKVVGIDMIPAEDPSVFADFGSSSKTVQVERDFEPESITRQDSRQ